MRNKIPILLLAVVAGITMMACPPMARPPVTTGNGGAGGETGTGDEPTPTGPTPTPNPTPTPTPQDDQKSWTISKAHFRDDGVNILSQTSNRSEPYAWDRITGDDVRVSIGGNKLPFKSTRYQPVFESDITGAEWEVTPEVDAGAVVLVLTAPDQTGSSVVGEVASVTITDGGSGYTSAPTVTFGAAPPGGTPATGTAVISSSVTSVTITTAGSDYTAVPAVTFEAAPSGGTTATGTVTAYYYVAGATITNGGSGYNAAPVVWFSAAPSGGTTATGTATISGFGGAVTQVVMTNAGAGYTSPPTVWFSGGFGTGATASVTAYYYVEGVTMTDAGSGYTSAPTVTFEAAPSGGTTATGTAVISSSVTSVTITNAGSGYTSAPTVTFSGGGGTGAAGTAFLEKRGNNQYQNLYWARQTLYGKQLLVQVGSGSE